MTSDQKLRNQHTYWATTSRTGTKLHSRSRCSGMGKYYQPRRVTLPSYTVLGPHDVCSRCD